MKLQTALRKKVKMKLAIQGSSGSGKTTSALLLAYGLTGNWSKIGVIDTENQSSNLYAHLGAYNVLNLESPFTPERYQEAISICEQANLEVIIIDSISHEWENLLDCHSSMAGNSFTNWSKITPRHNDFIQSILQSNCHIICTIRAKQDYVLVEKNNKQIPEKVGLKGITRDGLDYEMTLVFDIDIKHFATASKDRTCLFMDKSSFIITPQTGSIIKEWCNLKALPFQVNSEESIPVLDYSKLINSCSSIDELRKLYEVLDPNLQTKYTAIFSNRKFEIIGEQLPKN